jgi:hypothetical protein
MSPPAPRLWHAAFRGDLIRRSPVAPHRGGHVHGTCISVRRQHGGCPMRTLAIKLEEELHAQLGMIAKLEGLTLTDALRQAIDQWIDERRNNPELQARAAAVLADIDAEAATRRGAIEALLSNEGTSQQSTSPTRRGRGTAKGDATSDES